MEPRSDRFLSKWRTAACTAVLGLAMFAGAVSSTLPSPTGVMAAQAADCPSVVVPAYFDDPAAWQQMAATPEVGIVVLNVAHGPGKRPNEATADRVRQVQANSTLVVGYVRTGLAERPPKQVKREIRKYWRWYNVDGIFLDQVEDDMRHLGYYRKLSNAIRRGDNGLGDGGFVVLNPGYTPAEAYMAVADVVVNYEFFHRRYAGQQFPDWIHDYGADRFAHVVFNVPGTQDALEATLAEARENNAGYVFITDRDNPNEYKALPGFWEDKIDALCG